MNLLREAWFWLIIVGIIGLIYGIYIYNASKNSLNGVAWWSYITIVLSMLAIVLGLLSAVAYYYSIRI